MGRERKTDFRGVFGGISRVLELKLLSFIKFGIVKFERGNSG